MPLSWVPLPWSVTYLARRSAGVTAVLAEQVGVAFFPSRPPHDAGWAAGYAAGVLDSLDHLEPAAVRA